MTNDLTVTFKFGTAENRESEVRFCMKDQSFHELKDLLMEMRHTQGQILHRMEKLMSTLDEILADVEDESTKLDSLTTFIDGLKQQIADALAGVTLPPAVQKKVDAVFASVESNKAKVVAAMDANVQPPAL